MRGKQVEENTRRKLQQDRNFVTMVRDNLLLLDGITRFILRKSRAIPIYKNNAQQINDNLPSLHRQWSIFVPKVKENLLEQNEDKPEDLELSLSIDNGEDKEGIRNSLEKLYYSDGAAVHPSRLRLH